jgi:hypothetical protein
MRFKVLPVMTAVLGTACASAAVMPSFEFQPTTGPLRYTLHSVDGQVIETPMGAQEGEAITDVTFVMEVGGPTVGGLAFSAVIESLEGSSSEQGSYEGGDLVGKPYTGTLKPDGTIEITDGPETPASLENLFDAKGVWTELLPPLPGPGQMGAESWTYSRESVFETAMTLTSVTNGTARIVGDTTWNGVAAQVIVAESEVELTGIGTPPGAPGEIEVAVAGPLTVRYVWDGTRGVMLASNSQGELSGDVTVVGMGMSFPISFTGDADVTLQR